MNKEFIPYEQALELKIRGFDEECLGNYRLPSNRLITEWEIRNTPDNCLGVSAPLYQQAFRWLYQKLSIKNGTMPLDTESQQLLLKELIDNMSSKRFASI
jgi:hypothetical protein